MSPLGQHSPVDGSTDVDADDAALSFSDFFSPSNTEWLISQHVEPVHPATATQHKQRSQLFLAAR